MKLKILITGSKGQLGNEIQLLSKTRAEWEFIFTDLAELDITNPSALGDFFEKHKPDVLINSAAYTAVDKAEEQNELAELINAKAVELLAIECNKYNTFMLQVSTDFVFGGEKNTPYTENDLPRPLSVYAESKYLGEQAFMDVIRSGVIVRTSWLYSTFGNNFVKTMMKLGNERDALGVVYDQIGAPTYAFDLAEVILKLIDKKDRINKTEIFHYSNAGVASWFDFAVAVMENANLNCKVNPLLSEEYPLPATRPHYSLMNTKKIREFLSIDIPHWRESLKTCIKNLKN
jgi:dTDP-4-dehydrorhamnose reductase